MFNRLTHQPLRSILHLDCDVEVSVSGVDALPAHRVQDLAKGTALPHAAARITARGLGKVQLLPLCLAHADVSLWVALGS